MQRNKPARVLLCAVLVAAVLAWLGMPALIIGIGGFLGGLAIDQALWGGAFLDIKPGAGKDRRGLIGDHGIARRRDGWVSKQEWERRASERAGRPVTWEEVNGPEPKGEVG